MNLFIENEEKFIFPDTTFNADEKKIITPRNTYKGFYIKTKDAKGNYKLSVTSDADFNFSPSIYKPLLVNVNRNSDYYEVLDPLHTKDQMTFTKTAPFKVYDPLYPIKSDTLSIDEENNLYYIKLNIPKDIEPGTYNIKVSLEKDGEKVDAALTLKVFSAIIPDEINFDLTNWIVVNTKKYNCELYDDKFYEVLTEIFKFAKYVHQTYIPLLPNFFVCEKVDGEYIFDFTNIKKTIELARKIGIKKIEGPHITDLYKIFMQDDIKKDVYSDEARPFIIQFLTQWYNFLKENDYLDITINHVGDEPKDESVHLYKKLAKLVNEYLPNIPTVDAILSTEAGESIDVIVPLTRHYQLHKEEFDALIEKGKTFWLYICCWPTSPYLNRLLDMELLSTRLIHWLTLKLNAVGYLHYGFCIDLDTQDVYNKPSIPFRDTGIDTDEYLPAGDTNIVYPSDIGPIGSIRLEMHRLGMEDIALLQMLKEKDEKSFNKLMDLCITEEMTGNFENFDDAYEKLLSLI